MTTETRIQIVARRRVVTIAIEQFKRVKKELGDHHTMSVYQAFMSQRAFGIARSWDNPTMAHMDEIAGAFMAVTDAENYEIVYAD